MEINAGNYYRRFIDGAVVKVLHTEVYPHHCSCGTLGIWCRGDDETVVMYRMREGECPTRAEFCLRQDFPTLFEGPLGWDEALKEFK
jgi:hypothetical protein